MTHQIACLLHNSKCKDFLRTIQIQDIRITLLHKIAGTLSQPDIKIYNLYIVDSKHHDSEILLKHIAANNLYNSTIIVTSQFDRNTFQRYIKRGYRYIIDTDTFLYLIPIILENLTYFLQNSTHIPKEITKRGLVLSIECGCIIFHECKIFISKSAMILLCALLNSNSYCNTKYLQNYFEKSTTRHVSSSYITVTISRLNKEIYKATGMRIIKSRYGFGYYLDI